MGTYGSVVLRYHSPSRGNLFPMVMIHNIGQSIAFHIDATSEEQDLQQGSLEGIWWLPNDTATDYLLLTNLGSAPLQVDLSLYDSSGHEAKQKIALDAKATDRLSVRQLLQVTGLSGTFGGIKIFAPTHAGSLTSLHLLFDEKASLSVLMKMFDYNPSSRLEERDYAHTNVWTLRAPMLALSHPDPALAFPEGTVLRPQLFVRNALAKPVNITLGFNWHNASASGKTAGPAFRLGPYETRRVDVGALQTANMLPKNANWACVVLTTSGLPDEVVAVAASYDETLRVHQRDQFSGTWGRNLQPPVKMRVFRQSGLLPICPRIASTACARSHTKQNQGASLRNFKIGEVAFRAGPYKQGRRALRIAKLHIFDDQTRLRCPMGEQPRLCPVNHDRTDILRWGS